MIPIAIPNYNKAQYLKECLDSILAQTVPVEIYFYEDGSDDDSVQLVKDYKDYHMCNIHIYHGKENMGVAYVVNRLASIVYEDGHKYFCIVASDDTIAPDFVQKLSDILPTNFVTCNAKMYGVEDKVFVSYRNLTLEDYKSDSKLLTAGIYSVDMWNSLGGRREDWRLTHDYEFFVRMLRDGYDYDVVNEELYFWRNYDGQLSRQSLPEEWSRENAYKINNLKW